MITDPKTVPLLDPSALIVRILFCPMTIRWPKSFHPKRTFISAANKLQRAVSISKQVLR